MVRPLFPLFLLMMIVSCKSQKKIKNNQKDPLVLVQILKGNYSGQETEKLLKIENRLHLEELFGKINRTRKPGLPIPNINFEEKTIVIWFEGKTHSNKGGLQLGRVSEKTIYLKKSRKPSNNTAILTPFAIYSMPKTAKTVKIQ